MQNNDKGTINFLSQGDKEYVEKLQKMYVSLNKLIDEVVAAQGSEGTTLEQKIRGFSNSRNFLKDSIDLGGDDAGFGEYIGNGVYQTTTTSFENWIDLKNINGAFSVGDYLRFDIQVKDIITDSVYIDFSLRGYDSGVPIGSSNQLLGQKKHFGSSSNIPVDAYISLYVLAPTGVTESDDLRITIAAGSAKVIILGVYKA